MSEKNEEKTQGTPSSEAANTSALASLIVSYMPDADVSEEKIEESAVTLIKRLGLIQDKLTDVVEVYPEFGEALNAMIKGMPPAEAVARYIDVMDAPEGSPDFEAISKARDERKKELAAKKKEQDARAKMLKDNEQVSIDNFKKFKEESGMSDDEAADFLDKLTALQQDMFDGKLTPEHIEVLRKGFAFDKEVAKAEETGKVAGRNEQIEKKIKQSEKPDGVPSLKSSTGTQPPKKEKIFGAKFIEGVL